MTGRDVLITLLIVVGLIVVIIGPVLYFGIKSDNQWENKCHNHGGHSIETHGRSSQICVSPNGKVIEW